MEQVFHVGKDKAYQTIADALAAAAEFAAKHAPPTRIVLSGGRYAITAPLPITQSNLTICAAEGEAVTLTGSLPLTNPHWQKSSEHPAIYQTQLASNLAIDGFFIDDTPQILARYPSAVPDALPLGGVVTAADIKARSARWQHPETGYLRALHHMGWGGNDYLITGKDDAAETGLALAWVGDNNRGDAYLASAVMVEGILEELDAPNEWFYCAETGVLSYCPPADFDINAPHLFEVAVCSELFTIGGGLVENSADSTIDTAMRTAVASDANCANYTDPVADSIMQMPTHSAHFSADAPIENITISHLTLRNTKRSLFGCKQGGKAYQPLLRGDWAVVPSGAIYLENAKNITICDCNFENIGGNAIFMHGYHEGHRITRNRFCHLGACGIQAVGKPCAVDDPSFWAHAHYPDLQLHATTVKHPAHTGAVTEDYPRDIAITENYIHDIGQYEKQSSGINLSIASRVQILHNTIHQSARSNINVNDGSFGGHEIAYNDIFDAQRETTDHGPFNSWGRDRFWSVPSHNAIGKGGEVIRHYTNDGVNFYDTALLDAYQTTRIHHNRFHHAKGAPHTWGIDLDDGSSNYEIYCNLCLGLGIKLREGFARRVYNNIIIDGKLEIHVSYAGARDEIYRNLVVNTQPWNFIAVDETRFADAEYQVDGNWYYALGQEITLPEWYATAEMPLSDPPIEDDAHIVTHGLHKPHGHPQGASLQADLQETGTAALSTLSALSDLPAGDDAHIALHGSHKPDVHALRGVDPHFANPDTNDYTPTNTAAMDAIGFVPFAMDFGASPAPNTHTTQSPIYPLTAQSSAEGFAYHWQGAAFCNITDAIISATASAGYAGAYIISASGMAATLGLRGHDVIKAWDGAALKDAYEFVTALKRRANETPTPRTVLTIHREGQGQTIALL